MRMNYDYCYLDEDGMLRYMPMIIKDGGSYRVNPPPDVYAAHGGYKRRAIKHEHLDGVVWVENDPKDWAWDKDLMIVEVTYHAEDVPEPEPTPKRYNKYNLGVAIEDAGLLDAFLALFEANAKLKFHWNNADEFEEGDANFEAFKSAMIAAFGDETVTDILAKAEA